MERRHSLRQYKLAAVHSDLGYLTEVMKLSFAFQGNTNMNEFMRVGFVPILTGKETGAFAGLVVSFAPILEDAAYSLHSGGPKSQYAGIDVHVSRNYSDADKDVTIVQGYALALQLVPSW